MSHRSIRDIDLAGKKVFIRVDFNVPLDKNGTEVTSDTRVRAALPTIQLALKKGAAVIVASHLGRPKGRPKPSMSLDPIAPLLEKLLGQNVTKTGDCIGDEVNRLVAQMSPGDIVLLENLRFHAAEEENDPDFSAQLASLCDVYVNDAFGTAHRAHASTEGIARLVHKKAIGLLMEKELQYLTMALSKPERPYIAIVGGAKISGKIDVLDRFLELADKILIGGAMTYTFLHAQGIEVGGSLLEKDKLDVARTIINKAGDKLVLPKDHVIAAELQTDANIRVVDGYNEPIPSDMKGVDIGPETVDLYKKTLANARFIIWNGPMGVFEIPKFARGTLEMAHAIAESSGLSIVGGGDSEKAIRTAGVETSITHISTGGGASLEFLAGHRLPGIEVLSRTT